VHDLYKKRLTKSDAMVTTSAQGEGSVRPLLTHRDIWNRLCNNDPTFRETLVKQKKKKENKRGEDK
jgi:hypothetical protein